MSYARDQHIVVIGEMGVGKTTVGGRLARRLGMEFFDSDRMLELEQGRTSAEIAADEGVPALHAAELQAFQTVIERSRPVVMAPAASVVDAPSGRDLLDGAFVVWLTASDAVLAERQLADDHRRRVTPEERATLRERRQPYLEALADIRLDTGDPRPTEVVDLLVAELVTDIG